MRTVMLVGGAGYIGSHTAKFLSGKGILPVVYDDLSRGHRHAVQWGPFERGDIFDRKALLDAFVRYRPDAVMHFAALAYVGESVSDPARYYRNNVAGSLALLEAMREAGIKRLVFSSSCATYGVPAAQPITENCVQAPVNPYGHTKLVVERMLDAFDRAYGFPYVCLRYFNAAGADPAGDIGEEHLPETHLIPLAIETAQGGKAVLTVFGNDYPTPDGTCVRDYVHVQDLAQAHYLALEYLSGGGESDSYNLGNGDGYSIREILDAVAAQAGRNFPVEYAPRRAGDPPVLVGDSAKARRVLGWKPEFTTLKDIIETAWNWHERKRPQASKS
jgi:UDP-glucose-4-epimerase GalE